MPDLELLRRDVLTRLERLDADERSLLHDRADGTADDEHDPEGSTLSGEWSRVDALRRAALGELAEIDAAMARIADGTYGICARCGRPIPAERMKVRPTASLCVACA
ncbi:MULTISPECIES: TraR/DksA family transcriptional regulator [Microbacterium]|uniref:Molecular chaperone DnaK n=1 Tax=Microbacterium wangchenii TaxID=2541726 RepID=A0ABX5SQS8_9MICO|nr:MULTISPECIES: TraR/DksA C4-type zinc finger protein [Microbacterium]MCK6065031.1 TraR/DksA C4-type zinc finger protein [Microbacterium sp. EYE_512]QBR88500.1 molecular chaperone DnaK [Microbacterium wangchenii]TXK20227.1 molecular chaperone DnaK [Microbacterium wangchenii]